MRCEASRFQDVCPVGLGASAVITDPPYNLGFNYGPVSDKVPKDEYRTMFQDLADWSMQATLDDAHLMVIHYPEVIAEMWGCFAEWDFRQWVTWCYPSNIGHTAKRFTRSSRAIVHFTKGDPHFNSKADPEPYKNPSDKRVKALIDAGSPGRSPYDWQEINLQKNVGRDYSGYSNQLPSKLAERLVLSSTMPGQIVIDPFAGTGTIPAAADRLGRSGFAIDANPGAPCHQSTPNQP